MKGERLKRKWDPFSEWQHYWQTLVSRKRNGFYSFTFHALCTALIRSCSYFSHYSTWVLPCLWVENIYLRFLWCWDLTLVWDILYIWKEWAAMQCIGVSNCCAQYIGQYGDAVNGTFEVDEPPYPTVFPIRQ